jgi:signal transduction histidine kinase/ligand-binding sensor domain-containing protein
VLRTDGLDRERSVQFCMSQPGPVSRVHIQIGLVALILTLLACAQANAQHLTLRRYSIQDGLPSNSVTCVRRDSRGFLWFCTSEGIARFDGDKFTTYGLSEGLPDTGVFDFLQSHDGRYWVALRTGVAEFHPNHRPNEPLFTLSLATKPGRLAYELFEDRVGVLWAATGDGVYRLTDSRDGSKFEHIQIGSQPQQNVQLIAQDRQGTMWFVVGDYNPSILCWRSPDGASGCLTDSFLQNNRVTSILADQRDRIWLTTFHGLALLSPDPIHAKKLIGRVFSKRDGLEDEVSDGLFESRDGRLWFNAGGLLEILEQNGEPQVRMRGRSRDMFGAIQAEDVEGNFWMGAVKWVRDGFVTYGTADGLPTDDVRAIFEGQDSQLYVVTGIHCRFISRFDGERFHPVAPLVPGHSSSWDWGGWGWGQVHFQDHLGEWWVGNGYDLFHYPRAKRLQELATTIPRSVRRDEVFRMYEDSHGNVWSSGWKRAGLSRWDRASGESHSFGAAEGWPSAVATAFREDRAGNLWTGVWGGGLCRFRTGHFDCFRPEAGFPEGNCYAILLDHLGRLWAATTKSGLLRIDDPEATRPSVKIYNTNDGLSSNNVRAVIEDQNGRIYFWTGRGVDRLDPESGGILHYTTADGLIAPGSDHEVAYADRHGNLWFGFSGLSRLEPKPSPRVVAGPPVYLRSIRIRGVPLPISELGEESLTGVVLQPNQNNIEIEFGSLSFQFGRAIRYQYKLEDADQDWSTPSELRAVNYAGLKPGNYRFLVRTLNDRGQVSTSPAALSFRVVAPVWQRAWFLVLMGSLLALAAFTLFRYRLERRLELERMRTRIASDLHDDVGSGLTQIAILSEVARRSQSLDGSGEYLNRIADLSRELIDGMGEIVWSMNPQYDRMADLVQRMRRFASDLLVARGIDFNFVVDGLQDLPLRSDVRRQAYLVFKEALNNCVRHSKCTKIAIRFSLERDALHLDITDDGCGLPEDNGFSNGQTGHGINSMKTRARTLGGKLEIGPGLHRGTTVSLRVPLGGSLFHRDLKPT